MGQLLESYTEFKTQLTETSIEFRSDIFELKELGRQQSERIDRLVLSAQLQQQSMEQQGSRIEQLTLTVERAARTSERTSQTVERVAETVERIGFLTHSQDERIERLAATTERQAQSIEQLAATTQQQQRLIDLLLQGRTGSDRFDSEGSS